MDHAYNDPNISPHDFLEAVYRDPTVKLKHRMQAASLLVQIYNASLPQVVIHIGGFAEYDETAEPCADINDCINRTTPCPWEAVMRSIPGVNYRPCKEQLEQNAKNPRLN
jgi:hypothetical protein